MAIHSSQRPHVFIDRSRHSTQSVFVSAILLASLLGCSSESAAVCGAGTAPVDGVCVRVEPDAAGGADTAVADSSSDALVVDDSAVPPADAAADAVTDTFALGDPCPKPAAQVNCAVMCGGPTTNCGAVKCGALPGDVIHVKYAELTSPFVMRTPEKPGTDTACPTDCTAPVAKLVYAMRVVLDSSPAAYRITVSPPWRLYASGPSGARYCPSKDYGQCLIAPGFYDALIGTTDPNAVPRNVVIDRAPTGFKCP
jgi:hypothetical protein